MKIGVLADQVGFPIRTLHWIAAHEPGVLVTRVREKQTEFKQPDCAWNLRRREVDRARRDPPTPTSETAARTRKLTAEAAKAELELAKLRGQLVTVEDFAQELRRRIEPIADRLKAFPGRLAPQVFDVPTPAVAQSVIGDAVREILKQMQQDADRADNAAVTDEA